MHIICLTPLEEGVYNDHKADHITFPPEGWAYIPEDFPLPSTFPRLGSLEAVEKTYTAEDMSYTMMTVTAMTEGTLPEPVPTPEPEPTTEERIAALEKSKANQTDVDELAEALDMILAGVTE